MKRAVLLSVSIAFVAGAFSIKPHIENKEPATPVSSWYDPEKDETNDINWGWEK